MGSDTIKGGYPLWELTPEKGDTPSGERIKELLQHCLLIEEFSFAIFMKAIKTDRETLSETILFIGIEATDDISLTLTFFIL